MRWTWLLCTTPFALAPFACTSSFSSDSTGGGGTTSSSSSATSSSTGSGGGTGSGGFICNTPMDCPPPTSQCDTSDCVQHQCVRNPLAANTPVPNPIRGNCTAEICDGSGNQTTKPDPTDVFDDGNPCTDDVCVNSMPKNNPHLGRTCHDSSDARLKVCDDSGSCVECNVPGDCTSNLCVAKHCIVAQCQDGLADNQETDVDCGGPNCQPCGTNKTCLVASDCTSHVCSGSPKKCQAATCTDGVQNQDESDVDCGGMTCNPCGNGKGCSMPSDCVSQVCTGGSCAIPTCTDGKKNGGESDVDCGGATTCVRCPDGDKCNDNSDCFTNNCDPSGKCNHCDDGMTDFGETDVDCGGADCDPCGAGKGCQQQSDCDGGLKCCPSTSGGNSGVCQQHCGG